jgi:hypothetical protein
MTAVAKISRVLVGVDFDDKVGAIVQVLKECVHPVLFVPCPAGIVERSSS